MNYDQDALYSLHSVIDIGTPADHALCCICGRKMHKTALRAGCATQWQHDSSGHATSWSPSKHPAALVRVKVHAHRWQRPTMPSSVLHCIVTPCDAEMLDTVHAKVYVELTPKQLHVAESRRRGGETKRALAKAKAAAVAV